MLGGLPGNTRREKYHHLLLEIQRQLTSESKRMVTFGLPEVVGEINELQLAIESQSARNAQEELDQLLAQGALNERQQDVFDTVKEAFHQRKGRLIFVQVLYCSDA